MPACDDETGLTGLIRAFLDAGVGARPGVLLAGCGSFQLGGPCALLVDCESPEQVQAAFSVALHSARKRVFIGGGTNVLFSDAGFDGIVIRHVSPRPRLRPCDGGLEVDAGTLLDDLARESAERGLVGLEFASGIPGTVGGAVAGNAGAWGRHMSDVLSHARLLSPNGTLCEVAGGELAFAYRASRLQRSGEHLLSCRLRLGAGDPAVLLAERERILQTRAVKHPDWRTTPCIGSIFRNLEPTSRAERRVAAGHFLEQAGAKDMRVGGAGVFARHANIVIKESPRCTAQDVRDLILRMQEAVRVRFGVELHREVRYLGSFRHEPDHPGFF